MNVVLYSTHCPKCSVLEKKLQSANINYKLEEDQDLMIWKGFTSVPMLEVDGKVMDFKSAIEWVNKNVGDK